MITRVLTFQFFSAIRRISGKNRKSYNDTDARRRLVRLSGLRELERYAALVVLFAGRVQIEVADQDLAPVAGGQVKERRADYGIVRDFYCVSILKHKKSRRKRGLWFGCLGFLGLRRLGGVRRRRVLYWRDVRALS